MLPRWVVSNHLAVRILCAREVNHAGVISLFPTPGCFFSNISVPIGNDVRPSEQPASKAAARFAASVHKFRFRVLSVRTEHIPVAFDLKLFRTTCWVEQTN